MRHQPSRRFTRPCCVPLPTDDGHHYRRAFADNAEQELGSAAAATGKEAAVFQTYLPAKIDLGKPHPDSCVETAGACARLLSAPARPPARAPHLPDCRSGLRCVPRSARCGRPAGRPRRAADRSAGGGHRARATQHGSARAFSPRLAFERARRRPRLPPRSHRGAAFCVSAAAGDDRVC